mmetsp:Transcript_80724/g.218630  ORF Transcript_80724/g.218630 Transcript_80724/m.218630 type:complete len:232 (+) Transcript_80724:1114-1809(+)
MALGGGDLRLVRLEAALHRPQEVILAPEVLQITRLHFLQDLEIHQFGNAPLAVSNGTHRCAPLLWRLRLLGLRRLLLLLLLLLFLARGRGRGGARRRCSARRLPLQVCLEGSLDNLWVVLGRKGALSNWCLGRLGVRVRGLLDQRVLLAAGRKALAGAMTPGAAARASGGLHRTDADRIRLALAAALAELHLGVIRILVLAVPLGDVPHVQGVLAILFLDLDHLDPDGVVL